VVFDRRLVMSSSSNHVSRGGLSVDAVLVVFLLQESIDRLHRERASKPIDAAEYESFLTGIGYLVPEGPSFQIGTEGVDPEIAVLAGPQLVVPVSNARYALNAANARWGSLYDALYGTDALGTANTTRGYDPVRGKAVVGCTREFLDDVVPLRQGSHAEAARYLIDGERLVVEQLDGSRAELAEPSSFLGYTAAADAPRSVVLSHHGVIIESALTTILDFEDSVAAVDAADKVAGYRNWLGLMTRDLTEQVTKGNKTFTRRLSPDRVITAPDSSPRVLSTP
jgi:malate synthase